MSRAFETRRRTVRAAPGGLPDPFAGDDAGTATIAHGPYAESIPIAGLTVGQVRRRFRDRYNIPEHGQGQIDGLPVDDETVIAAGQVLTFMHRSNSKGAGSPARRLWRSRRPAHSTPAVALDGDAVVVETPERGRLDAPLSAVLPELAPRWFSDCVWLDGVKLVVEKSRGAIVVHQTPSRVHNLRWIHTDSAHPFGRGARYRDVKVALPYVVVLAVYRAGRDGRLQLSQANECFFRNAPLRSVDDELLYPALLNVSRFENQSDQHPLAWICSQHLDRSFEKIAATGERSRAALAELVHHLLDGGFNLSSEHHEGGSWFGATAAAKVDERVADVDRWQQATAEDPMFATEVPWLPTGLTLAQVVERTANLLKLDGDNPVGAADLALAVMRRATRQARQGKQQSKQKDLFGHELDAEPEVPLADGEEEA